jgi:hypothetical protein
MRRSLPVGTIRAPRCRPRTAFSACSTGPLSALPAYRREPTRRQPHDGVMHPTGIQGIHLSALVGQPIAEREDRVLRVVR